MASPGKKAFLLRMDPSIHDAVQRWADDDMRSLNAQIEFLLREALRRAGRKPAKTRSGTAKPGGDNGDTDAP